MSDKKELSEKGKALKKRVSTKEYRDNWEKIFNKKENKDDTNEKPRK